MKKEYFHFQKDIIDSCLKIEDYTKKLSFREFVRDVKSYDAVLMNLLIIGEAANNFSKEIKKKNPSIDWKIIISMRNFLIHEYFEIDPKIVWQTIKKDIPLLFDKIQNMEL